MKKIVVFFLVLALFPQGVFADETITSTALCNALTSVGTAANEAVAQPFTPSIHGEIAALSFNISKNNTPVDNARWGIQADSAGSPSGVYLGSVDIAPAAIAAYPTYTTFTDQALSATVEVFSGTQYWVVFSRTGAMHASDNYDDCGDAAGSGKKHYTTGAWSAVAETLRFSLTIAETPLPETSSTSTPDQVQQNVFQGWLVFFLTFVFIVWFFRRPYDTY